MPALNAFSRYNERQADRYAFRIHRQRRAFYFLDEQTGRAESGGANAFQVGGMVFPFSSGDFKKARRGGAVGTYAERTSTRLRIKSIRYSRLLGTVMVFFVAAAVAGQSRSAHCNGCREWNRPQAPFRVFGNTYHVGTHGLSSILITSPAGHVLIDGDLPQSVPQIVSHLRSLGFRIEDVRVIVNSHVHFDHAGGIAKLQRLSGARVMASEWSAAVMRRGGVGEGDPQYGVIAPIDRIKNVHELRDGESFTVGDVVITAHLTAGHTPGGTSWTWRSCESGVCRSMVYADSLTPVSADGFKFTSSRVYPSALTDFEKKLSVPGDDAVRCSDHRASGVFRIMGSSGCPNARCCPRSDGGSKRLPATCYARTPATCRTSCTGAGWGEQEHSVNSQTLRLRIAITRCRSSSVSTPMLS